MSPLVLLLAEVDLIPEEGRGKKNPSRPRSSSGSKIVLILLIEVIAVHVRFFAVYVRGTGLQLLPGHLGGDVSWGDSGSGSWSGNGSGNRGSSKSGSWDGNGSESLSLQNSLKNPLQVIFGILGDISSGDRDVSNGRFCL